MSLSFLALFAAIVFADFLVFAICLAILDWRLKTLLNKPDYSAWGIHFTEPEERR